MKKVFYRSVMICLLLALVLSGCAKNAAKQTEEVAPPQKAAPSESGQGMKAPEGAPAETAAPSTAAVSTSFDKKVFFDFDKFDLSPESIETLNGLAAFLKSNTALKVKIEGNCDERGTIEYNLALGERRAKAALDYVVSQGIDAARLTTISYG